MKMKNYFFEFWIFILSRSIVYLLSFISYKEFLFDIFKIYNILKKGLIEIYLKKYYIDIITFLVLIIIPFIFYKFIKNKIKNSSTKQEKIIYIKKVGIDSQLDYLATFLLPLIAGFQKINFTWIIFYEIFIFVIVIKDVNSYYKKIFSIFYKEYNITLENGNEICVFSKEKEIKLRNQIGKDTLLKSVNIYNEILGDRIYFY